MSEMVERVASVLSAAHDMYPDSATSRSDARSAIAAMREPTAAMIDQVAGAMYDHFTSADIPLAPKDAQTLRERLRKAAIDNWHAMIDAALKEWNP
jgi:hypothetical protein